MLDAECSGPTADPERYAAAGWEPAGSETGRQLRLGELVLRAAALDAGERESFLRHAAAGDPLLLEEARRRLEDARAMPSAFLADPTGLAAEVLGGEPDAGTTLAAGERYRLEECLGSGGMARVYRAVDRQLHRPVALKLLDRRAPLLATALREARAQARVRHDNVLEVYETGELDGQPYIAMRCVTGRTLLELGDETGWPDPGRPDPGRPDPSLEQQIRILAAVAEGLHAAHREGLIHRDVKPSNILIEEGPDGELKPYVSDFGIAADATGPGASGLAGTPAYMAPELFREAGSVDRRTDVYSLGVTMYQLFTGELPFAGESAEELIERLLDEAPRPPRELVPALPADVEAVVMKCLEKDPERRYPSARAVAEDLRRYLDGEVVEAHAATLGYRLAKFALRHRLLLALGGVASLLLLAALVAAALLGVEAIRANDAAERRRHQAEELIDFMLFDLRDGLETIDRLDLLDQVARSSREYFESLDPDDATDGTVYQRGISFLNIGDVVRQQGDTQAALGDYRKAERLFERRLAAEPARPEWRDGLGKSRVRIGHILARRGATEAALAAYHQAVALAEGLVEQDPKNRDRRFDLAHAHLRIAQLHDGRGELGPALEAARTALAHGRELTREASDVHWRHWLLLIDVRSRMGHMLAARDDIDGALESLAAARALAERLAVEDPAQATWRQRLAVILDREAHLEISRGHPRAALAAARSSMAVYEDLAAADPTRLGWQVGIAWNRSLIGAIHQRRGELDEALELYRGALEIRTALTAQDPDNHWWQDSAAYSHEDCGRVHLERGDGAAALRSFAAARAIRQRLADADGSDLVARSALAWNHLLTGRAHARQGDDGTARREWARAVELIDGVRSESDGVSFRDIHAQALLHLGRREEARPLVARLLERGWDDPEFVRLVEASGLR